MNGGRIVILHRLAILAAFLVLPFRAIAQDKAPSHASTDDCAVLAEASKALQKTGDKNDAPMSPTSYGVDCNWKAFGMAAPVVASVVSGPYYPGVRFSFTRPIYAANGLQATTDYTMGGNGGPASYFYVGYRCTTQKRDGRWQNAACKMQFIT
jgi:hypothetical protein